MNKSLHCNSLYWYNRHPTMRMKLPVSSRPPSLLPLAALLATASTYALPNVDVREVVEEAPDEKGTRYVDALLMATISWNVMVVVSVS